MGELSGFGRSFEADALPGCRRLCSAAPSPEFAAAAEKSINSKRSGRALDGGTRGHILRRGSGSSGVPGPRSPTFRCPRSSYSALEGMHQKGEFGSKMNHGGFWKLQPVKRRPGPHLAPRAPRAGGVRVLELAGVCSASGKAAGR